MTDQTEEQTVDQKPVTSDVHVRTYTVSELKTFIDAVEFLHDEETAFVPNARQWNRLRDMIMNLSTASEQIRPVQRSQPPHYAQQPQHTHVEDTQFASHHLAAPAIPAVPVGPSAFAGTPSGAPVVSSPVFSGQAGMPSRTPTIDTSNGATYTSSFA